MANPYAWAFENPELLLLYAAAILFLLAFLYWAFRKQWKWYVSIRATAEDRYNGGIPPDDITSDIVGFLAVTSAELVLIGAYIHLVT